VTSILLMDAARSISAPGDKGLDALVHAVAQTHAHFTERARYGERLLPTIEEIEAELGDGKRKSQRDEHASERP
jgi:hypothetical protein